MQYALYDVDLFTYIDRTMPKKLKKKMTGFHDQFIWTIARCSSIMPGYYNDLLFNITCDDAKWVKDGKKIVFIGEKMAHDLICSKAVVSKAASADFHITLPFDNFMVSLPKDLTMPDGTVIPPFMVTICSEKDSLDGMYNVTREAAKTHAFAEQRKVSLSNYSPRTEPRLAFRFQPEKVGETATQLLDPEEIPILMAAESPQEFVEMRKGKGLDSRSVQLTDEETTIGYYILKLLVSLSMYHESTGGKYLREGLPDDSGNVGIKASIRAKNNSNTVTLTSPTSEKGYADRKAHVRGWHYRNLRADRYYQGEFASKPKGSRWVLVASSLVAGRTGGEPTPFTQA